MPTVPVSVVIPTLDRPARLAQTLRSLSSQTVLPREIVVVDASDALFPSAPLVAEAGRLGIALTVHAATQRGAAAQRNEAVARSSQPYLLFMDDDVDLATNALERLWRTLQDDPRIGAANVVLSNQHYHPPGTLMRHLLRLCGCPAEGSLAGQFCGPALNFLPAAAAEPRALQWANLVTTLCRREALPEPPFLSFFHGYSLLEDAALTAYIARRWKLVGVADTEAFHDRAPASYKNRIWARTVMETVNRWFVMTRILERTGWRWTLRLQAYQLLMLGLSLRHLEGWKLLLPRLAGQVAGTWKIVREHKSWIGYPKPAAS